MADAKPKFGATGDFPDGKLNAYDEGGLMMGISNDGKLVRVDFGTPVAWLSVTPQIAMQMGANLIAHATQIMSKGKTDGTA